jgi:hypothetical protein
MFETNLYLLLDLSQYYPYLRVERKLLLYIIFPLESELL